MKIFKLKEFIKEIINEQLEIRDALKPAIDLIEEYLNNYQEVKIGKTSNIENRFDSTYKKEGYKELIQIKKCTTKRMMDDLEVQLIKYFGDRVNNNQIGGGNKSYSQDYWIYIVVK